MPAPKGHPPYPGCEKGGCFGYLGMRDEAYTEEDAKKLGDGLLAHMKQKDSMWFKTYFAYEGLNNGTIDTLKTKFPYFAMCIKQAKIIQESKLVDLPFFKKADTNIAKFVLTNNHEGWVEKPDINAGIDAELLEGFKAYMAQLKSMQDKPKE